jgi:hypothetical protein
MRTGAAFGQGNEHKHRDAAGNNARHGTDPSRPLASAKSLEAKLSAVYAESLEVVAAFSAPASNDG